MIKVVLFNKPYGVHSQFRREHDEMITLADFITDKSLRIAGRLDKDSEGLVLLTNSGALNHAITTPNHIGKIGKTYLVQVENIPTSEQLHTLSTGVTLKDGTTLPAIVKPLDKLPITIWDRSPPIRKRKNIPTAWLSITIYEGKNRQVRRMCAHVGLPCLRLIRQQIGTWSLRQGERQLAVGEHIALTITDDVLNRIIHQAKPAQSNPIKNFYKRR